MAPADLRRLARRGDVVWRRIHDGVLLRPRSGSIVRLGATGPDVWDLLANPQTLAELSRVLGDAYAADPDDIAQDLLPVIDELVAAGVLEWR